jgi:HK97 family phage major capsid protein/HK97 family phage prohead protease
MDKFEFKAALSVDEAGTVTGTAWPFGSADRVGDIITKGAFTAPSTLPMLFAHDQAQAIGVWDSITETSDGLTVKGRLLIDDVARAREVRALVREGAVTGLSIGFVTKQAQSRRGGGRTISALDLHEISIVPVPSHPGARIISAKSAISKESTLDQDETAVAPNIAALETKLAEVAGEVKGVTKLNDRLDRIEAKLNRPGIELKADNDNGGLERKAFVSFVRRGREAMGAEEIKSLVVANDVQGGYLAPPELSTEMIRNLTLFSPVRAAASVGATGSTSVILPKRTSITNALWEGETDTSEESEPAFGQLEIPVFGMKTYTDISVQLLEDSIQNVETELSIALSEDFGRKEGVAFLNGTGVKQPRGIMVCPDIGFVSNGDVANLKADALIDLLYSLPPVYRNRGSWMMNGTTIAAVRKLKTTVGEYLWQESLADGAPPTLLGRPVIEAIDMPDIASGSFPILFGDFKSGYRIYDRVSLALLRDPFTQATNSLVRFHARRRVGGDVIRPAALMKLKMAA